MQLKIGYEAKDRPNHTIFYVGVRDLFGAEILHLNTGHLLMENNLPASGTIHCTIPRLTLTPGEYHVYLAAICDAALADKVEDVLTLDVAIGETFSNADFSASTSGKCFVEHSWQTSLT